MGEGHECGQLMRIVRQVQPSLVVLDAVLPGDVWETAGIIDTENLAALLITGRGRDPEQIRKKDYNSEFTVINTDYPAESRVMGTIVEVLCREFMKRRKVSEQVNTLNSKLQSRVVIERAKGAIMKEKGLDEADAYRLLQRSSMESRKPLQTVAGEYLTRISRIER